ncbi:MAG: hypothetical protein SWH68_13350 [Thermodesulfobacteriota bacterium]|nr:hypothetical protein [Thermodesulfobacteriota bacterium]
MNMSIKYLRAVCLLWLMVITAGCAGMHTERLVIPHDAHQQAAPISPQRTVAGVARIDITPPPRRAMAWPGIPQWREWGRVFAAG